MAHDIFISYSHIDKASADAVCAYMEKRGLRCWYAPRDIEAGEDWAESIINAIRSSRVLVLIFTNNSNFSHQVMREIDNAVSAGATIIPLRLEREEPSEGMKYYLSAVHWMDAYDMKLDKAISGLYKLCRAIIDNKPVQLKISDGTLPQEKNEPTAAKKPSGKKLGLMIGIPTLALVLVAAGIIVFISLKGKSAQGGSGNSGAGWLEGEYHVYDPNEDDSRTVEEIPLTDDGYAECTTYIDYDGEWYYYLSNKDRRLFRMHYDESGVTRLTDFSVDYFCYYDGYIYIMSRDTQNPLCRMKPDGSEFDDRIYSSFGDFSLFQICGDFIYSGSYMIPIDGGEITEFERPDNVYIYVTDGEYLYYTNEDDYNSLYRAKLGGGEPEMVFDAEVRSIELFGGSVYINSAEPAGIFEYKTKTNELIQLMGGEHEGLSVCEKGVISYNVDNVGFYIYSFYDGSVEKVRTGGGYNFGAAGGKLVWGDIDGNNVINYDGSGSVLLN